MKCPNCGATLDYVDENIIKCPYCATKHANTEFRKTDSGDLGDLMEKVFQDSNGNGVPDVFEGDGVTKIGTTYVTVNGKPLNDMEELPDNIKEIVGGLGNDNFANISKIQISQSQPQQASTPDKLEDDFQYRELKELLSQAKPGKAYPLGLVILLVTGTIYLIIAIMIIRAVPSNTFAPFAIGLAGFSLASVLYFFSKIEVGLPVTRQPPRRSLLAILSHKALRYYSLRTKTKVNSSIQQFEARVSENASAFH